MGRFVVRYRGAGSKPANVVEQIRALRGGSILEATDKMLLVEAEERDLRAIIGSGPSWIIAPEQSYEIPEKPLQVRQFRD